MDPFVRGLLTQPALGAAVELELARRSSAGDPSARDELVTAAMRSVVQRALMLGARGERLRDAVQAGAVGLLGAVDHFDPDRGVRLATYAWHAVGGAILAELRAGDRPTGDLADRATVDATGSDELLDGLPAECRDVVRLRFGTGADSAPMTRADVARELGTTESWVRSTEAEAMRHLRRGLAKIDDRAPEPSDALPL